LVIWYVGKEKAPQIASAYDRHVMFLLFICAFMFLNLNDASEKALSNFAFLSFQFKSLYDLMESDKDMALLVVKEQLSHFRIKILIEKECKYPLHGGKSMRYIFPMLVLYLTKFGDYLLLY
jgi:hypothetical protein